MSLLIKNSDIVDRDYECNLMQELLGKCAAEGGAHTILLCADTGYGKSSIMRKVKAADSDFSKRIIIVETPRENDNTTPVEGQYLNLIAETINREFNAEYSIETFLYSSDSDFQSLMDTDAILQAGHSFNSAAAAKIGQVLLTELKAQRLLYDTSPDSILVLKNYIKAAIIRKRIILDITNAQNMDITTLRVIRDILKPPSRDTLILEYTTQDCDVTNAIRLAEVLGCPYSIAEVDRLPFEFALTILGMPVNLNKISEIEDFYQNVVKGNLYRIIQAKMDAASTFDVDPIKKKISSLGFAAKMLLAFLCLNGGEMEFHDFNDLLNLVQESFFIPPNWEEELSTLIEQNEKIKLRHASIIESYSLTADNASALAAYKYLVTFYERKSSVADVFVQRKAVVQLVKLHSKFDPKRMVPLLGQFKGAVISKLSEEDAFSLIKQAFDSLGPKSETEFHIRLIGLCYEAGFYKGSLGLLEQLQPITKESSQAYLCMLLNRNDRHEEAIDRCNALSKKAKNPRYRLIALLIKMLSERSLNQIKECQKTFHKIEGKDEFHELLEYGFFLRNAQIILSYRSSLDYIHRSIDFFRYKEEYQYAAHSELTYLVQLARLGELKDSQRLLSKISESLLSFTYEKHIAYVNEAAIRLLSNLADSKTLRLLDKALLTVTTVFDRLVILNNKLCTLILKHGALSDFEQLQASLEDELEDEPDQQMRRKTYTNFFLYHRNVSGNHQEAEHWRQAAISIESKYRHQTIEDVFLLGETPEDNLEFLATRKFCISFITYWHFDIPFLDE